MPVDLRLLSGGPEEMAALQQVLEGAPTYAERVTGHPPGPADAQSLMTILPPDIDYADKFVWGVLLDDEMVGCADVIRGWPPRRHRSHRTAGVGRGARRPRTWPRRLRSDRGTGALVAAGLHA